MKRFPLFFGLVAACALAACGQTAATPSADDAQADTQAADVAEDVTATTNYLALRPLSVAADRRIVDDLNREVILRGTNITSLGEYWQGDPDHKPTLELTEADWQEMAAQGFSANRLVVHWSKLEPTRGTMDEAYVQRIDDYVKAAAAHGMYTVIDMHQDAYSSFIFTTLPGDCTGTNHAAKGWDGAPKWATLTDGLSTCITGDRNSSPAVVAAWNHFYDNSDGIRDRFVATWGALAAHFAGRPEVAGYNFLNEPEVSRPGGELGPLYNQLVADVAKAVRAAEAKAAFGHLLIIEPAFAAGNPAFGLVVPDPASVNMDVQNVVAGPHNYAEAIGNGLNLSIEDMNQLYLGAANSIGVPMWIGEHGFWGTDDATLARLDRYAADEDKLVMGGACQRDWLHGVPAFDTLNVRVSLTWRWARRAGRPDTNPGYFEGRQFSDGPRRQGTRVRRSAS